MSQNFRMTELGRPMSKRVNKGKASMKLGGGGRFKALTKTLSARGARDPKALAASIGRKTLGKARFQRLATKGRSRKSKSGGGTWGEVT